MSRTTTTTAVRTILASALVASGIGAQTLGAAGATTHEVVEPSVTTAVSARQESATQIETASEPELLVTETTIHTENQDQHDMVAWALSRYEQAGLELPPVEIHIHSDRSECGGLKGSLNDLGGAGYVVHSCGNDYTLLHELAHAWDLHSLDEATRNRLLEIAEATTWKSDNWLLSGAEHAANVVAWGLLEERINQTRTRPYDHDSMLEAYGTLTGGGEPLWLAP